MPMLSKLDPGSATTVGVLTAAGVYLIFNNAVPSIADVRVNPPHDADIEAARKAATWKSVALISIVFLVARDLNSYIISGAALVGIDYMYKHANAVHPATGKVDTGGGALTVAPGLSEAYSMPDYTSDAM
jgi:hypothetical protein